MTPSPEGDKSAGSWMTAALSDTRHWSPTSDTCVAAPPSIVPMNELIHGTVEAFIERRPTTVVIVTQAARVSTTFASRYANEVCVRHI